MEGHSASAPFLLNTPDNGPFIMGEFLDSDAGFDWDIYGPLPELRSYDYTADWVKTRKMDVPWIKDSSIPFRQPPLQLTEEEINALWYRSPCQSSKSTTPSILDLCFDDDYIYGEIYDTGYDHTSMFADELSEHKSLLVPQVVDTVKLPQNVPCRPPKDPVSVAYVPLNDIVDLVSDELSGLSSEYEVSTSRHSAPEDYKETNNDSAHSAPSISLPGKVGDAESSDFNIANETFVYTSLSSASTSVRRQQLPSTVTVGHDDAESNSDNCQLTESASEDEYVPKALSTQHKGKRAVRPAPKALSQENSSNIDNKLSKSGPSSRKDAPSHKAKRSKYSEADLWCRVLVNGVVCRRRSQTPSQCAKHRDTHYSPRYRCSHCSAEFSRSSALTRHIQHLSECSKHVGHSSTWGKNMDKFKLCEPHWLKDGQLQDWPDPTLFSINV